MSNVIEIPYPFVLDTFNNVDDEGNGFSDESWRPGTKRIPCPDDWLGEVEKAIANGMGLMLLTIVKEVELPRNFRDRIFYIRRWRDPEGKEFGKNVLRVTTDTGFKRLLNGYRYSYRLEE